MEKAKKRILCAFFLFVSVLVLFTACSSIDTEDELESKRDSLKQYETSTDTEAADLETETETFEVPETETALKTDTEAQTEETVNTETTVIAELSEPTLDFDHLHSENPDICAWIEIEGTNIDYPILQNPSNDLEYLRKAYDGTAYTGGEFFTQATYNSNDFNDPVTVIYGHAMRAGTMFGKLQKIYTDLDSIKEHSDIKIYLPDEVRHYKVFAAVPYDSIHILHTYDFEVEYWYNNFFKGVRKIREIGSYYDDEIIPEHGDRVIILSTCLAGDKTRRFLVMAILSDDI